MRAAADDEEFEQATLERNRLRAVRSLLERRRVASESVGTLDAVAVAVEGRDANAQVFQVRDGVLSDRQSFYLANETEREPRGGGRGVHPPVLRRRACRSRRCSSSSAALRRRPALAEALGEPPRRPVEMRAAERGEKRRILELAERNARLALDQERLRAERRRQSRVEALDGLQRGARPGRAPDPDRVLRHLQPRRHAHGRLDGRVRGRRAEEVRLPPLPIRRRGGRARRLRGHGGGAVRRFAQWERQHDLSPHDPAYDASFAALPNVMVIDGGQGSAPAGSRRSRASASAASRSSRWPSASRRSSCPAARAARARPRHARAAAAPARARRGAPLRDRRTIASRRDRAMTGSILDELPGVGPARKRALLKHFGSPERCSGLAARSSRRSRAARQGRPRALRAAAPDRGLGA